MKRTDKTYNILIIEDNPADAMLISEAFRQCKLPFDINVVGNGSDALKILYDLDKNDLKMPNIILMDLQMPGTDGVELLGTLKHDLRLKVIPVIVLTGSKDNKKLVKSYRAHANSVIQKPGSVSGMLDIANAIEGFWLKHALLPELGKKETAA